MGVAAAALSFLNDSTLPLFYFQSFHIAFGDEVDQFEGPVTVNISNPNKFRFRLVDGQYTIRHASRPVGGGVFSPVYLRARGVSTAATSAYLYGISSPVRDELVEGRDRGAVFDVEMQVKARVGVWLIETKIKDFYVNCRLSVDRLSEDAKVNSSQCRSYYRKS
ncbi:uncharacterized protein A4U43_C10F3010 [Asparagus officinalis]|uniref:Late embryogenesis abundant protein LEA-2 subgroup domain-containing protein n=1 Tax=Asparagus officinalis TaxID=4686 RepID=A0A5P1E073_ASPOF|nr:uncharacterized protein A4U43_C10F3010 [Asparagus officinalis]